MTRSRLKRFGWARARSKEPHEDDPAGALSGNHHWERDRVFLMQRSERRAWIAAAAGGTVGVLGLTTAAVGGALRQLVAVPIVVDKTTGETTIVQRLSDETVPAVEALDKHNAAKYVRTRERYYWQFLNDDLHEVARTTTPDAFASYAKRYDKGNSLADQLKRATEWRVAVVAVRFTSVSKPGHQGEAIVTYDKEDFSLDRDAVQAKTRNVATLLYEYQPGIALNETDRLENPLGFLVTAYRSDPELSSN